MLGFLNAEPMLERRAVRRDDPRHRATGSKTVDVPPCGLPASRTFSWRCLRIQLGNYRRGRIVSVQLLRGDVIMAVRKPAPERKAEILEATLRLADELGPDRLSTEAIARAVGLTQPGIFRHFPTNRRSGKRSRRRSPTKWPLAGELFLTVAAHRSIACGA